MKHQLLDKENQLNFNYDNYSYLGKLKKIELNLEKKLDLSSTFNNIIIKDKSSSVKKNDKKKIYYENDIKNYKKNNNDNKNNLFEMKKISYNRYKK